MSSCPRRARSRHTLSAVLLVLGVLLAGLVASPAEAAVPKPRGLKVSNAGSGPVLAWKPVRRAVRYRVEVSSTRSFGSLLWESETVNVRSTPTGVLPTGRLHWRVRAITASAESGWATASFSRARRSGPELIGPQSGVTLQQPEDPPVLRWEPVAGATSYVVEIDGVERDWVDVETYTTQTTSTVVNEPQPVGTYWWRVHAVLGGGINTKPSDERSYSVAPLRRVSLKQTAPEMEDVVLSWDPVPGAVAYEIRVSTDNGFNKITDQRTVSGTQYSPVTTYDNASYWWQVRAVNALNQSEEWPVYPERTGEFRRSWLREPDLQHPADGAAAGQDDLYFEWSPVRLASRYVLDIGTDPAFSNTNFFDTCVTTQTTYAARWNPARPFGETCMPAKAGTYYWRVRAVDDPANRPNGINSRFSAVRSFTYAPGTVTDTELTAVSGQRLRLSGTGSRSCAKALPAVCDELRATPVFDWDPVPGAAYYRLYLAHDVNFTNMVEGYGDAAAPDTLPTTANTLWVAKGALPDTQAGEAYYWFVRPCRADHTCALTPREATHAFRKKSPPVALRSPAAGATLPDQVTFEWTDYLATNQATTDAETGEKPEQAAQQYRVQVSDSPTFASRLDDRYVDQTTYTAYDRHYPEGELYWRVQAVDGSGNGLTWSETRAFTHRSPAPRVLSPTDGEVLGNVQPFRWQALDYAKYYDIEVYRNGDTTASSANRAAYGYNIRQTAFTWDRPLQSLGGDLVWRIRRTDYSGNKSAWGPWHRFRIRAAAPRLVSPKSGARLDSRRGFFRWRPVPQAASYRLQLRHGPQIYTVDTVSTSYATVSDLQSGRWTWRVTALDASRQVVRETAWRKLRLR